MKTLTVVAILWLAVSLTSVCSAEVEDRAGKDWNCRVKDGTIYAVDGFGNHIYNIQAAKKAKNKEESDWKTHDPICISPGREHITWNWPGAKKIKVTFSSLTDDHRCENSKQPFRSVLPESDNSVQSDVADENSWGCAYEVYFSSSNLGKFDPHIIIRGTGPGAGLSMEIKQLKEEIKQLETTLQEIKKDLERLEKKEEKDSKDHE
jgi:hypothetical protein